jgi:hypothetical protein
MMKEQRRHMLDRAATRKTSYMSFLMCIPWHRSKLVRRAPDLSGLLRHQCSAASASCATSCVFSSRKTWPCCWPAHNMGEIETLSKVPYRDTASTLDASTRVCTEGMHHKISADVCAQDLWHGNASWRGHDDSSSIVSTCRPRQQQTQTHAVFSTRSMNLRPKVQNGSAFLRIDIGDAVAG